MIHVGVGDEYRLDGFDHPLDQVGDLAAVEEQSPPHGTDAQEDERIVQQAAEAGRLAIAEWKTTFEADHV